MYNNYANNNIGPSQPHGVQTFCSAVGWRTPLKPNGKVISYDIQLMRMGVNNNSVSYSVGGDRTFMAIPSDYQQIGRVVRVRIDQ